MIQRFARGKGLLVTLGLSLTLLFLLACASEGPSPTNGTAAAGAPSAIGGIRDVQPAITSDNSVAQSGSGLPFQFTSADRSNTGISVTGRGKATAAPDLATLNLGVESFASTVAAARSEAADAMEQVVQVLRSNGLSDPDIQTRHFNINPRYTSHEVTRCVDEGGCFKEREQVIIGYQVSNQVTVKVRDLDNLGDVIDQVTAAGGNLIKFQGVQFTIENAKTLEETARAAAVADLLAKADQIAELSGVSRGLPVFISEVSGSVPQPLAFANRAMLGAEAASATPILAGELDVVVTLQAVFAIQ